MKCILSSSELMEARANHDHAQIQVILRQMNAVVYGKKITPQMREGENNLFLVLVYYW